jgi:hypothetical protein
MNVWLTAGGVLSGSTMRSLRTLRRRSQG